MYPLQTASTFCFSYVDLHTTTAMYSVSNTCVSLLSSTTVFGTSSLFSKLCCSISKSISFLSHTQLPVFHGLSLCSRPVQLQPKSSTPSRRSIDCVHSEMTFVDNTTSAEHRNQCTDEHALQTCLLMHTPQTAWPVYCPSHNGSLLYSLL